MEESATAGSTAVQVILLVLLASSFEPRYKQEVKNPIQAVHGVEKSGTKSPPQPVVKQPKKQ